MDRYELGFKISELLCKSNEPLTDIKYLAKILLESYNVYSERFDVRIKTALKLLMEES